MRVLHDIGVLGSGPAALSIASACSQRGASVVLVAPEPEASWQPNYCLWADEVSSAFNHLVEHSWPEASVVTPFGSRVLGRPYAKLHTRELQRFFWSTLRAAGVQVISDRATRLEHRPGETRIHTEDGAPVRARVVIDSSGARSPFVQLAHRRPPAFQTAFGLMLRAPGHGFDSNRMVLMDYRPASGDETDPPSFLYALPMGDGRLFLEETSLARRPAMRFDVLRERLAVRLRALGLERCEQVGEELCSIAMGVGLPVPQQPLVPFGAAAAMVHPSSGYLISHVLRKVEPVADSVLEGLSSNDAALAIALGNATLWPRAERTVWELYSFGLETLVGMNAKEIACFFDSFFALPRRGWSGFLAGTLPPSELGLVMTRLFASLPLSVQWHLLRTGLSTGAAPLLRSADRPERKLS